MSTSASLDIEISPRGQNALSAVKIIQELIGIGWKITRDNKMLYLPYCSNDEYDWQEECILENNFFDLVKRKEQSKEIIGVGLFWNDTEIGVTLLLFPDYSISFCTTINRKVLLGNITDVNWYLEKIIPCLETDYMVIEYFKFTQSI